MNSSTLNPHNNNHNKANGLSLRSAIPHDLVSQKLCYNRVMQILNAPIKKSSLKDCQNKIGDFAVKAVVDVKRQLLAIDAEMHADLEQFLLENGSDQYDLWGINLYFNESDLDDFIEYDSLINIRPSQHNRSRGVDSPDIRKKIVGVVSKWIN